MGRRTGCGRTPSADGSGRPAGESGTPPEGEGTTTEGIRRRTRRLAAKTGILDEYYQSGLPVAQPADPDLSADSIGAGRGEAGRGDRFKTTLSSWLRTRRSRRVLLRIGSWSVRFRVVLASPRWKSGDGRKRPGSSTYLRTVGPFVHAQHWHLATSETHPHCVLSPPGATAGPPRRLWLADAVAELERCSGSRAGEVAGEHVVSCARVPKLEPLRHRRSVEDAAW